MNSKKKMHKQIIFLQLAVILYTFSGIAAKKASAARIWSLDFFILYSLVLFFLFVYALLWQQILKTSDLSLAYLNKSTAIIWTALWAVLFFGETISIQNIIGAVLVMTGIILVFKDA